MKFIISVTEFQKALQITMPAIPRKLTIPVLEHLLFDLGNNSLSVIATDQDVTIKTEVVVEVIETGSVLVPARKLSDILKSLGTTGSVEFNVDEENYEIKLKTISGNYSLKGLSPDEYVNTPELTGSSVPDMANVNVNSEDLKDIAVQFKKEDLVKITSKTAFAVSEDEFRPAMTGILFEFKGNKMNAVTTDSFRLVRATIKVDTEIFPTDLNIILPARLAGMIANLQADTIMSFLETNKKLTHVRFDSGNNVLISRIIDEKFPPYETVIPFGTDHKANVNIKEFLQAIRRISIVTSKVTHQIKITMSENLMTLNGRDEESGDFGQEEIACNYSDIEMMLGFNHRFLDEALTHMQDLTSDGNIIFRFNEQNKPVLLNVSEEDDSILMLIMPVRLSS
jgi:DNA polymerase III subunit beta